MSTPILVLLAALAGILVGVALDRFMPTLPYEVRRRVPARRLLLPIAGGLLLGWLGLRFATEPVVLAISALYSAVYLAVAAIDYETHRIPNVVILPATGVALLLSLPDPRLSSLGAILGALVSFGLLFAAVLVAERLFGGGAFGMGDAKLGAFMGATTGLPNVVLALLLGILAAGIGAVLLLATGRVSRRTYLPYGPFLCLGGWLTLIWGRQILVWWLT